MQRLSVQEHYGNDKGMSLKHINKWIALIATLLQLKEVRHD